MEKIYGKHELVGLPTFLSGTPTFSSGTPTFCQMGVLNSCFQNPSESSVIFSVLCLGQDFWGGGDTGAPLPTVVIPLRRFGSRHLF